MDKNDKEIVTNACALLIGVGDDLPATEKDAQRLYDILIDPKLGGYSPKRIKLLKGKNSTAKEIRESFTWLKEETKRKEASTTIIFYSGHGGVFESFGAEGFTSDYYLLPYGYDQAQLADTSISGAEISDLVQAVNSRKLVVFLDCCHAGGIPVFKRTKESRKFKQLAMPAELVAGLEAGSGRVAVASSRDYELSIAKEDYSIFTDSLINALTGAVARYDPFIRILEVVSYLFRDVPARTKGKQNTFVKGIQNLSDNFALCLASEDRRMDYAVPPDEIQLLSWDEYQNLTAEFEAQFLIKNAFRDRVNEYRVQQALNYQPSTAESIVDAETGERRATAFDLQLRELETLYLKALKDLYSLRDKINRGWREPKLLAHFTFDAADKIRYSKDEQSYEIRLFIQDYPLDLKSVTYILDSSFSEPERQASKSDPQFEEFITSYGEFSITAVLHFENGTEYKIIRWLSSILEDYYRFHEPRETIKKAVTKATEAIVDEYFA